MNENLLTIKELAAHLQVPFSWIYSRTRQKGKDRIPTYRVGKYIRFRLSEVLAWLARQQEVEND